MDAATSTILWTDHVKFHPFVGPQYWDGLQDGLRVLLLSESHYDSDGQADANFTIENFSDFSTTPEVHGRHGFFGKVQRIAARNPDSSPKQSMHAWRRLAFMNYVQGSVGTGWAHRPTAVQWKSGAPALSEAVAKLKPHVILVMGKLVWNRIHEGHPIPGCGIPAKRQMRELWAIPHSDGRSVCTWIYHPARNMESLQDSINVFNSLLRFASSHQISG